MFIALIVVAVVIVALVLMLPLYRRPAAATAAKASPAASSADLRQQLRDLEFDRATGKVEEEDYAQLKATLQQELDAVLAARPATTATPKTAHAARRQHSRARWIEAAAEAEIAIARARLRLQATKEKCAHCGRILAADDQFCASCGAARERSTGAVAPAEPG